MALRGMVQRGELSPGDQVPTENELMKHFRVSRITVRAAVKQLQQEGVFVRRRGVGTFVKEGQNPPTTCMSSFTEDCFNAGSIPSARLLSLSRAKTIEFAISDLPFDANEEVVRIDRLRSVDGVPAGIVRSYIPHSVIPGIDDSHLKESGSAQSLLYVLEQQFGQMLDKGTETTVAVQLSSEDATFLGVEPGDPAILKSCVVNNVQGEPILYEDAVWCRPKTVSLERKAIMSK